VKTYKPIFFTLLALGMASGGFAQSWDNSGNGLLKGTYYFRHVLWFVGDQYGDLGDALTLYNTISFDGNGNYTITGATIYDAYENESEQFSVTGTYTIAASGYGFIQSPASQFIGEIIGATLSTPDEIYGLVANGVFMGSATENANGYNDMFIAAPAGSASAGTFSGSYAIAGMDAPGLGSQYGIVYTLDYLIQGTADGNGNFNVSKAAGYIGAGLGEATSQNGIGDAKYTFSNGAANINFNNNIDNVGGTALVAGSHYMYISPDGNFVFGGEPYGWDFFVGVKTGGSFNYTGLYYQAGMDLDDSYLDEDETGLQDSYFSAFKAESVAHQRVNSFANTDSSGDIIPFDYTFIDDVTISGNSGSDGYQNYLYSANGQYRIGVGIFPGLGFSAAIAAPTFKGSGLALDPTGIVNTGSNTLFTSRIAPGELITLYGQSGSTLASGAAESTNLTLPTTLDNTQITVNGVKAPVLAVNECGPYPCVTFVVPYETVSPGIADIQLLNGSNSSNIISAFVGYTAPGLFTLPQLGQGSFNMYYSATIHANGTIVSPSNPAEIGETIAVFLTGIGNVTPSVLDGAPGPTNPTAGPVNTLDVYISSTSASGAQGLQATTAYVGLAPAEVAGLAQINFTVPSGATAGDNVVEVVGPDSDTYMALISVSSSTVAAARPAAVTTSRPMHRPVRANHTPAKLRQLHHLEFNTAKAQRG
jgi:uncharacterized protein (TIGR03437 family)